MAQGPEVQGSNPDENENFSATSYHVVIQTEAKALCSKQYQVLAEQNYVI